MSNIYKQILMENVLDIIKKRGFYYIRTKVLYPDFVGPEYIIVTDDTDIAKKYPKMVGMIIVSISKFESMAEEYNRYYANEIKHIRRIERSYNDEGYSEDGIEDENGDTHSNLPNVDPHPVDDLIDQRETAEEIQRAMVNLTEKQKRRVEMFYFQQYTEREIAEIEGVQRYAIRSSLKAAISKMKKIL